jgi:hypothetical protein
LNCKISNNVGSIDDLPELLDERSIPALPRELLDDSVRFYAERIIKEVVPVMIYDWNITSKHPDYNNGGIEPFLSGIDKLIQDEMLKPIYLLMISNRWNYFIVNLILGRYTDEFFKQIENLTNGEQYEAFCDGSNVLKLTRFQQFRLMLNWNDWFIAYGPPQENWDLDNNYFGDENSTDGGDIVYLNGVLLNPEQEVVEEEVDNSIIQLTQYSYGTLEEQVTRQLNIVTPVMFYNWDIILEIFKEKTRYGNFEYSMDDFYGWNKIRECYDKERITLEDEHLKPVNAMMNSSIELERNTVISILNSITDEFYTKSMELTLEKKIWSHIHCYDYPDGTNWETTTPMVRFRVMLNWNAFVVSIGVGCDINNHQDSDGNSASTNDNWIN